MSEHVEATVPGAADPEPGTVTGTGESTETFDTQPGPAQDVAAVAEENARLRAALVAENQKLEEALATSRAATADLAGGGLTDEDVRRLENPHEFAVDLEALEGRVAALEAKAGTSSTTEPVAV